MEKEIYENLPKTQNILLFKGRSTPAMIRALYNSKEYRKNEDNKYLPRYSVFRKIRRRYTMPKLFEVYPVAKVGNMMLVWP